MDMVGAQLKLCQENAQQVNMLMTDDSLNSDSECGRMVVTKLQGSPFALFSCSMLYTITL